MLRFRKARNLRFEDQIDTFRYPFQGLTFGKRFTLLGIPKGPQHIDSGLVSYLTSAKEKSDTVNEKLLIEIAERERIE